MKMLTIAVTAIVVSLDSFMAGFSLSLNKRPSSVLPAAVSLITLLMCTVTTFVGAVISHYAESFTDIAGGVLLFILAAATLLKKENIGMCLTDVGIAESCAIGVAVGMDAAIANLSFAGELPALLTPIIFAVTHYLTVALGQVLAKKVQLVHTNIFSAVILAALAMTKLL